MILLGNMSRSSSDSDISSSYSSDGEIPCSHTKQYEFKMKKTDNLEFDDAESFACFPEEEEIRSSSSINWKEKDGDCVVIPSSVQGVLNKSIRKRIMFFGKSHKTIVYIKSPLLTFRNEELPAPRNVICDAFIFPSTGPVSVLTFVRKNSDKAVNYNSTLSRQLTIEVRKQTGSDFYPAHGTVEKHIWESQDAFTDLVNLFKEKATKIAIPLSLNMEEESLKKVLLIFKQMFAGLRLSSLQSELFERFVETSSYKQVKDLLDQHKLLILTGVAGEGKSTIGKKLCYDYQQRGFNTAFYSGQQGVDWDAMKEMKQSLVVCDNVDDYVDIMHLEKIINTCKVVIIMQTHDMRFLFGNDETKVEVVDVTDIRKHADSTKTDFLKILKVSLGDIQECRLEHIVSNVPQCVGFPKIVSHYKMSNAAGNPVNYFKYPLKFVQSEIEKLSQTSKLKCFLFLLLCGGRMKESRKEEQKRALRVLKSKFTYIWEDYVVKRLRSFIGSFCDENNDTISFSHQVIYDACLIVLDAQFPGFLWKHCKVQFGNEEIRSECLSILEPFTIFISERSNELLMERLVTDIHEGKIKDTLAHGILRNKANVDTFLTELAHHFDEVVHQEEMFLFWVVESFNEYLCNRILERKEIIQQDINYVLSHLTAPKQTKYFLFLREHLKRMQRRDVCYSVEVQDEEGNTLLMKALKQKNYDLAEILISDSKHFHMKNKRGNNVLHISTHTGNLKLTKLLLLKMDDGDKGMTGEHLRTPIMIAAVRNHHEIFKILADEERCDLKGVDEHEDTLLHLACVGGNVEIVDRLFISNEFDLQQRDHYGRTLLMTAALLAKGDLFMWLLEHKCHISSQDFDISDLLLPGHVEHFGTITKFLQARSYGLIGRFFTCKPTKDSNLKTYLDGKLPSMKLEDESFLHQAAKSGHVKLAKLLISKGKIDIDTADDSGQTPVMIAAKEGKQEMFDFLVSKNCNLYLTDNMESGVIHFACCGGNTEIVKKLIDFKTDLNSINKLGETPVFHTIKHGDEDMISTLALEGCDLSVVDHDRNTLLHLASKRGNTTILEHLLLWKKDMYINALNIDMQTPVLVAAYGGHTELSLRLISVGAGIDVKDYECNNVLLVAAKKGNEELFKCVLDQISSVAHTNVKDEDTTSDTEDVLHLSVVQLQMQPTFNIEDTDNRGNNMLHAACYGGNVGIVSLLLDIRPNIEIKNRMGKTAVIIAAEKGHGDVFNLLVIKGCALEGTDNTKRTILHSACHGGNIDIVMHILKEKIIDIDSRDNNGVTPLMAAAERGHAEVFSLLYVVGCNYSAVDDVSHNVLHIACKGGSSSIVHLILHENKMVDVDLADQQGKTAIFMAAETGGKGNFDHLLEKGADRNVIDEDGNTILHAASRGGNIDIVQHILLHDICDINSKNFRNTTPVMDAAEKGHEAVFCLLKEKDCTLTNVAGDNSTILHAASKGGSKGIVQALLTSKIADINSIDSKGRTPVIEAADKGHKAVFDLLVKLGCDLKLSSRDNYTILHAACFGGSMAIVRDLLSRKVADTNSKWFGTTPAGMTRYNRHHAISELLKDFSLNSAKDNCQDGN